MKKDVAMRCDVPYPLGMSLLPFPSDSAEFEEYTSVMAAMADEAEASAPDPEPEGFGGRCEDAPCCGCCGNDSFDSCDEPSGWSPDEESDDLRAREEEDHCASMYEREDAEDRYLDSYWEDQSEYGVEGCCGDF